MNQLKNKSGSKIKANNSVIKQQHFLQAFKNLSFLQNIVKNNK
tara:strand:- start:509 stop:637 length:129 start_codon:yes stop_codon:yes gene_type:complete